MPVYSASIAATLKSYSDGSRGASVFRAGVYNRRLTGILSLVFSLVYIYIQVPGEFGLQIEREDDEKRW